MKANNWNDQTKFYLTEMWNSGHIFVIVISVFSFIYLVNILDLEEKKCVLIELKLVSSNIKTSRRQLGVDSDKITEVGEIKFGEEKQFQETNSYLD